MPHKDTALGRYVSFNSYSKAVSSKENCSKSLGQPSEVPHLVSGLQVEQKGIQRALGLSLGPQ